jgi:hypothetical protein
MTFCKPPGLVAMVPWVCSLVRLGLCGPKGRLPYSVDATGRFHKHISNPVPSLKRREERSNGITRTKSHSLKSRR